MERVVNYGYTLKGLYMDTNNNSKISVIIPVLNAEKYIKALLDALFEQTVKPDEIVVVDSESEDRTTLICSQYANVRIILIKRKDFDHGKTRDMALRTCDSDYILFITQDAYPKDEYCLNHLNTMKILQFPLEGR